MKKSYYKFITIGALAAVTLIYSCKKFLDKAPVGSLKPRGSCQ